MTLFALGLSYKGELLLAFEFAVFSGRFKLFVSRKESQITHHRGQIPSGLGRRAGISSGADAAEFSLAYMVAFQHAILHPVS
jgi:hypothetical protein